MARSMDEVARFRTNKELYDANYDHIFNKKKPEQKCIGCENVLTEDEILYLINTCNKCEQEVQDVDI